MNSALYQELINPSKFNLIAALTLIALIFLSIIAILITFLNKPKKKEEPYSLSNEKGKGF
tara:strand:+ start:378 stop:557 length:180 start_codon:yes stop_codon:yes gene_type:complete